MKCPSVVLLLLAFLLAGCGNPDLTMEGRGYQYPAHSCLHGVYSDMELASAPLVHNIDLARTMMVERFPTAFPSDEKWCQEFSAVTVVVLARNVWQTSIVGEVDECPPEAEKADLCKFGEYRVVPNVAYVNYDMGSLLHELLHAYESHHLAVGTINHAGWLDNGFYKAGWNYMQVVQKATDDGPYISDSAVQ